MAPTDGTVPNEDPDSNQVREEESESFVVPGVPNPDALIRRSIKRHTLDKLEVVKMYVPAFTRACNRARDRGQEVVYAEGFSGPGLNEFRGRILPGTPLIALSAQPPFTRAVLLEYDAGNVASLYAATRSFGDRAQVYQGDCNVDLVPILRANVSRFDPCLCVLDPEGFELGYETIAGIAQVKRRFKVEQLILFSTHMGFLRTLNTAGYISQNVVDGMDKLFGTRAWLEIYERRLAGLISTDRATTEYVQLYAAGLKACGYKVVHDRAITDRGHNGRIRYFLVFATDHDAGDRIMDSVFDRAIANREEAGQGKLFDIKPERRKRLDE